MSDLQPNGNPVRVGSVVLRTPGLAGDATSTRPGAGGRRARGPAPTVLDQALADAGLQTLETIEIAQPREVPGGGARTRSASHGEPAIELDVPDPGEQWGQVVLYQDEAGVSTWNFARGTDGSVTTTRGRGTRTYLIPRRVNPAAQAGTRGVGSVIVKKALKVLVFPLIDPLIGEVGDYFAARWEAAKRPYGLRPVTAAGLTPDGPQLTAADWQRLSQGRALLLLHGTFSRAQTAFGPLPSDYLVKLIELYSGRVFSFDHFTISDDPQANVEWLLRQLPAGLSLDLDIVSHSRGGLVGRVLAERQTRLSGLNGRTLKVGKLVFVATPNAGTVLAQPAHFGDLVDSFTNIVTFFPAPGIVDMMGAVIAVVKQLAVAAANGLEGLRSMEPNGAFLTELNQEAATDTRYYALAADYEPTDRETGLKTFAKDLLFDTLFDAENDLVVPTLGVWDKNGASRFPVTNRHVFDAAAGIQHSGFFANAAAREKILGWLSA